MVPNPISLLIGQMRGTSHESQTAWPGCLDRRTTHPVHKSPRGITGEGWTVHPVHNAPLGEGESPYNRLLLQEVPQAPWSSQSSMRASCRTLIRGSLNDSMSFGKVINLTFPRGFDKMSATCTSVSMRWSLLAHRLTISQIRQYLISIC